MVRPSEGDEVVMARRQVELVEPFGPTTKQNFPGRNFPTRPWAPSTARTVNAK